MLPRNFATKIQTNQILKKKENLENLLLNFQTTINMPEKIKPGVEGRVETEKQKVLSKVHLPHMRTKTAQSKNDLHLMNKGSIQHISLREEKDFASLQEDTK